MASERKAPAAAAAALEAAEEDEDDQQISTTKKLARSSVDDSFDILVMETSSREKRRAPLDADQLQRRGAQRAARAERAAERFFRQEESRVVSEAPENDVARRFDLERLRELERRRAAEEKLRRSERKEDVVKVRPEMIEQTVDREISEALEAACQVERKAIAARKALADLNKPTKMPPQKNVAKPSTKRDTLPPPRKIPPPPRKTIPEETVRAQLLAQEEKRAARTQRVVQMQREAREQRKAKILACEREREERAAKSRAMHRRDKIKAGLRAVERLRELETRERRRSVDNAARSAVQVALCATTFSSEQSTIATQAAARAVCAAEKDEDRKLKRDRQLAERAVAKALDAEAAKAADAAAASLAAASAKANTTLDLAISFQGKVFKVRMPGTWASKPARKMLNSFLKGYVLGKKRLLGASKEDFELRTRSEEEAGTACPTSVVDLDQTSVGDVVDAAVGGRLFVTTKKSI